MFLQLVRKVDHLLVRVLGEHGQGVDHDHVRFRGEDVVHDPLEDPVHLRLAPLESGHVEVEEAEVAPGEVVRDVQAHRLHLGEERLRRHLGGEEVDVQPLLHRTPHDLLGEYTLAGVVLPLDQGEGPEREAVRDLLVDLVVAGREDLLILTSEKT